jgi:hypothetical protein
MRIDREKETPGRDQMAGRVSEREIGYEDGTQEV